MKRSARLARQGYFLIFSLLIVTGLTALTTVSITRSTMDLTAANRFVAGQQAFALAEGGTDCAIQGLQFNPDNATVGTACSVFPIGGTLTVAVTDLNPPTATKRLIVSTWTAASGLTSELRTVVSRTISSPFQQAAYAVGEQPTYWGAGLQFFNGVSVDSYDSRLGAYGATFGGPTNIAAHGDVRSNATAADGSLGSSIWVGGSAPPGLYGDGTSPSVVKGSAYVRPGAGIYVETGSSITGSQGTKPVQKFATPVMPDPPPDCEPLGHLYVSSTQVVEYTGTSYCADSITINGVLRFPNLQTLYVNGEVIVVYNGRLEAGQGTISIADQLYTEGGSSNVLNLKGTNGPLTIYADYLNIFDGSLEGAGKDPNKLRIYVGHRGAYGFAQSVRVYGVIYDADPTSDGVWIDGGQIFGAVIGQAVAGQSFYLHFDEALKDATDWPSWMRADVKVLAQWNAD